jgi:hypothetical protein
MGWMRGCCHISADVKFMFHERSLQCVAPQKVFQSEEPFGRLPDFLNQHVIAPELGALIETDF